MDKELKPCPFCGGESVINVMYNSVSSIIVAMQDGFVFGRTKEEAEAKLAELKGTEE